MTFKAKYADGIVGYGRVCKDQVELADLPPLDDVAIGVASNDPFQKITDGQGKGIVGLAFPKLNVLGQGPEPLFDIIMKAGHLADNIFFFAISKVTNRSELVSGATSSWAAGEPVWTPVDQSGGHWNIAMAMNGISARAIVSERNLPRSDRECCLTDSRSLSCPHSSIPATL